MGILVKFTRIAVPNFMGADAFGSIQTDYPPEVPGCHWEHSSLTPGPKILADCSERICIAKDSPDFATLTMNGNSLLLKVNVLDPYTANF